MFTFDALKQENYYFQSTYQVVQVTLELLAFPLVRRDQVDFLPNTFHTFHVITHRQRTYK